MSDPEQIAALCDRIDDAAHNGISAILTSDAWELLLAYRAEVAKREALEVAVRKVVQHAIPCRTDGITDFDVPVNLIQDLAAALPKEES